MADTTDGDTEVLYLGLLAPALITLIPGLVIHSFIIGVNVSDWWRGRSVTPVDHVVTSLGISRIFCQLTMTMGLIVSVFFFNNQKPVYLLALDSAYESFVFDNIWLTSLFSIVLCLKISNLHTRLFLYLRRMILHRTGCLIVAAGIFSALYTFMFLLFSLYKTKNHEKYNATKVNVFEDCTFKHAIFSFIIGTCLPLLFYCISSGLLFISLYHHTTRMKMSSNLSINLETYYSVMRLVSYTFLYNTIYFFGHFIANLFYYFYCVEFVWLYIIFGFLPALHSTYLIYRTAKLRNQLSKVLQNVIDFLFQSK